MMQKLEERAADLKATKIGHVSRVKAAQENNN